MKNTNPLIVKIRKLLRRHRQELTGLIGPFRAITPPNAWGSLRLVATSGKTYTASVTETNGDGRPDWLNVDDTETGAFIATLD